MSLSESGLRRRKLRHRAATIAYTVVMGMALTAQAQEATLFGRVTDSTGDALPGVNITAINQDTGLHRTAQTDSRGQYRIPSLPVGTYTIRAELPGFRTVTQEGHRLQIGQQAVVEFVLELAPVEESVTVTATTPLVEVRQAEVATNISEEQVRTLPMQNRQWLDLATLAPATGQDAIRKVFYNSVNIGAGVTFYSNGFYVDGVSNNWQQQGEPRQDFPQDGIAEFKVHSVNAGAEFGLAQGGYLNVVTKSGTNEYKGSVFEFFRTKALNSKTVFQDEKPDFRRHQYGGSIGGPIIRDKSHFFTSFEYTDETEFFTVNTRGFFPEEEGTFERPNWNYMILARYDHTLSESHRFFLRYGRQNNELTFRGAGGINARSASFHFGAPRDSIVLGETWFLGANTFNDFRVQWAKATYIGWPAGSVKWARSGEFPPERVDVGPIIHRPSLNVGNQSAFLGPERHFQIKDDVSHFFGSHELKFGVSFNWIDWEPDNVGVAPEWSFATDRPFNPDDPSTFPFNFQQRLLPLYDDFENTENSLYVDDTWTVIDRLVFNLGLRYDWQTGVWNENLLEEEVPEIRVRDRVVRPAGRLDPALFPFYDGSTRGDGNNFGPRVGLVWDLDGDGRQTLHAAYGIYYNRYRANGAPRAERNPEGLLVVIRNPSYPDPYEGRDPFEVARAQRNFNIQSNENRNPYTHQYSVGYSRQFGTDWSVNLDAILADGRNQHTQVDFNYFATPEDRRDSVRPRAGIGRVTAGLTDGKLRYRAVTTKVNRRLSERWQLLASYTLADVKADSESFPADHFNRPADFGHVDADRRHRMTISGLVELPGGWVSSGILRYMSSLPFNVTAGADLNGDGITNDRPPGVNFNDGCRDLELDAVNRYRSANGRAAASEVSCPSFLTIDGVLTKRFAIGADNYLEAIFQVFNLFNRANFFPPVGNALSGTFGQSLAVAEARQMELAIRFRF